MDDYQVELTRLIGDVSEATRSKGEVWGRIQHNPHDDALWEEYDIWHREEQERTEQVRELRRRHLAGSPATPPEA
jgi:hypothetical protein